MACITWCAPILPGKLEQWRSFMTEIQGPRAAEHRASRQRHGITREVVSHMATPMGDLVCLFHEGPGVDTAFQQISQSSDPYDKWFIQNIGEIHGITPETMGGAIPATLDMDFRTEVDLREKAHQPTG